LRKEELDILIGELAQLATQHIVNSYVVGISSIQQ
jgi:hypothetical protein